MAKIEGVIGLDKLQGKLKALAPAIEKEVAKQLYVGALAIEAEAKTQITQGTKSGRTYKRRSVTHQASAPGEAPANDTGRLVNSIHVTTDEGGQVARVHAGPGAVSYAAALEFGTSKMAERPFSRPALAKAKPEIEKKLKAGIQKVIDSQAKT